MFPGIECPGPSNSVFDSFFSFYSVDLQQQIMTIVDELGKASAKVLGSLRLKGRPLWAQQTREPWVL